MRSCYRSPAISPISSRASCSINAISSSIETQKYSKAFRGLLERDGIGIIRLPPNSPKLNAYVERFVGSIKEEALSRIIFFGEASLRRVVQDYMTHYLAERNHQGIDNRLITASNVIALTEGAVKRRSRLGGMLRFYYREAA